MSKRFTLGIDLDSTLNTLDKDWIAIYNQDYSDNLTREDMIRWEIDTYVKPECNKKIYDYLLKANFFKNLGVQMFAQEVTKRLLEIFDIYIVTAYHPKTCYDKCEWIKEHFPHIPVENVIFCNNKGLIHTDVLIDDGGHNLLAYHKNNKSGFTIVFDAPWNRYLGHQFVRADNWIDIEEYLYEWRNEVCNT